jgi:hypothetical protein
MTGYQACAMHLWCREFSKPEGDKRWRESTRTRLGDRIPASCIPEVLVRSWEYAYINWTDFEGYVNHHNIGDL